MTKCRLYVCKRHEYRTSQLLNRLWLINSLFNINMWKRLTLSVKYKKLIYRWQTARRIVQYAKAWLTPKTRIITYVLPRQTR